jgi:preprotein translocase subunit SecA
VNESLAQGAAALGAGNGSGTPAAAVATAAAAAAAPTPGSAILRGGPADPPTARPMRESLGDQPVTGGGGPSASGPKPGFTPSGARIGRNDPCWCGSGAKYKKCHGR